MKKSGTNERNTLSPFLGTASLALSMAFAFGLTVLTQPAKAQTLSPLHAFKGGRNDGGTDGAYPQAGLIMDRVGNLYGTTSAGGVVMNNCLGIGCGTVFRMANKGSGWVLFPLYNFQGGSDGQVPEARLIFGPDGTLYGTTTEGGQGTCNSGSGCGVVFNLRPPPGVCKSFVCPWVETILYRFSGGADGARPFGELAFDQAGNLYGTTTAGGFTGSGDCMDFGCGVVYKLTPSNGNWTETVLYSFMGGTDGANPDGGVVVAASGNLYGVTGVGGQYLCYLESTCGTVFQLSPSQSGWTKTAIYTFQGSDDGYFPRADLVFDGSGNLYGSTSNGGTNGGGTIFRLIPSGGHWMFSVLYGLTGKSNQSGGPAGTLAMDQAGNLYGAALGDGTHLLGSVFKLTPANGSWLYTNLHDFTGENDGAYPFDGLLLDVQGNLYGTAEEDGSFSRGLVFQITPD